MIAIIDVKLKIRVMKKISIVIFSLFFSLAFNSCKDEPKEPTIYVKYNWTAGLEYYSDNIPITYVAGNSNARVYQGPVPAGAYTYRYKLSSENTERSGVILLSAPLRMPDKENSRKYLIGIYNNNMEITFIDE